MAQCLIKIDLIDSRASALPAQSGINEAAFGCTEDCLVTQK